MISRAQNYRAARLVKATDSFCKDALRIDRRQTGSWHMDVLSAFRTSDFTETDGFSTKRFGADLTGILPRSSGLGKLMVLSAADPTAQLEELTYNPTLQGIPAE
jgi:hypothetical protein